MTQLRVITPEGEKFVSLDEKLHSIALPDTWNEKEAFERVSTVDAKINIYIVRDYTETDKQGNFVYNNARVLVDPAYAVEIEELLKADYGKTQEEYIEEKKEQTDPIALFDKRLTLLEQAIAKLLEGTTK